MFRQITTSELHSLLKEIKIDLIDIRNTDDYKLGHIGDALNIPRDKLMNNPNNYFSLNKNYYIICQSGEEGKKTGHSLSKLGYYIINVVGGYKEWRGKLEK
ncbi:MAG: rhodanese domain protein [Haloplasmataceae bacterium]|jgi:rhodanese-related sulfurtransferase|nr:rhodanese domain protein [Haloplasmataceae bacterium]